VTRVLVDCDPGLDDALALLLVLASPELELAGVTTVAGNQTIEKTTENALKVLELAGRNEIPVAAGAAGPLVGELVLADDAHGETGLGNLVLPEPSAQALGRLAVDFMAEQLLAAAEPMTVVAVGPLTNVGLLLALRPEAAERIGRLVLMGGAIREGNMTPSAEFNIWIDPEAAHRVFTAGLDVTMVGLDTTNRCVLTRADAERLRCSTSTWATTSRPTPTGARRSTMRLPSPTSSGQSFLRSSDATSISRSLGSAAGARSSTCGGGRCSPSRMRTSPWASTPRGSASYS
jgi:pyrimidine-specific ribonucleoside hydrolase